MEQGFLGLRDEDFWRDPEATMDEVMKGFRAGPGIALDGPAAVRLEERRTVPLAGVRACSARDNRELDLRRMALLATVELETGTVHAGPAFYVRNPARPEPVPPEPDAGPDDLRDEYPDATVLDPFSLELRDRLPLLPLRRGTLVSRLLVHDRASNPVTTRLERERSRDPEVLRFLERQRRPAYPAPVQPRARRHGLPSYDQEAHSPEPPAGVGLELKVPRIVVRERSPHILVRAAFRVDAWRRDVVRPRPDGATGAAGAATRDDPSLWRDVGDERATAVVPMTLVALGDQVPDPVVIPLQVPVRSPVDPDADTNRVRGFFNLDLLALTDQIRRSQTHALWVFYRSELWGPFRMALVSEDMMAEASR